MSEEIEETPITEEDQETENQDLQDDDEIPPFEDENEAKEVNTTNIIAIIAVAVIAIICVVMIASNLFSKKKKNTEEAELDKAGVKTVIEFKDRSSVEYSSVNEERPVTADKSEKEIENIIEELPVEFQLPSQEPVGKAPITPAGTRTSSVSERPDTKGSKSPRKIEGLAALDYSSSQNVLNTVSSMLQGNSNGYSRSMSKDEYIANQMYQTQRLQEGLSGSSSSTYSPSLKEEFFNSGSGQGGKGSYLSKASLWDGTIISGALVTAINTDNPGVVIARVTENVYSSQDHSYLLIPEGSLLMATYNSSVTYGQKQVQIAWNLLIRPDNYRISLGNMNGVNAQGASGVKGMVSNHPFETLKALGLVAVYSILQTEVSKDIDAQNNEYLKNALTDVYSEASKIGNKIVDRALDIKPTIKIKEGTPVKLITNVPLELPPVEINQATQKYIRTRK